MYLKSISVGLPTTHNFSPAQVDALEAVQVCGALGFGLLQRCCVHHERHLLV